MAPRNGASTAMRMAPIVFALPHHCEACGGVKCPAATFTKKIGKTAFVMVVWNDEMAQSYIAHARSSRRCNPSALRKPVRGRAGVMTCLVKGSVLKQISVCADPRPVQH